MAKAKPKPRRKKKATPRKPLSAAAEHFVRGVLIRGEASKRDRKGKLPLDATHEIVEAPATGLPVLRRERFKLV